MFSSIFKAKKLISTAVATGLVLSVGTLVAPAQAASNVLVVGASQGIPQLNPIIRTFTFEETLFPLLWSGLTTWLPDGSIGPDLATDWHDNVAATVWTFRIQKGAKFSDGSPLNAAAVKALFDYARLSSTVTQEANKISMVSSVKASGNTVTFNLSKPDAMFPAAVAWIKMIKVGEVSKFNVKPSTSGPYMVKSFTPNVSLDMVRNPNYFGDPAKIAEIKFVVAADPTAAVTSLRSGDINVLYQVPLSSASSLKSDSAIKLIQPAVPTTAVTWEYDVNSAPFNDIRVRQAIAYATDRNAILQAAYYGFGQVSSYNTIVPDNSAWQCGTAGGLTQYSFNLQKAKALFAAAGVSSFNWWGVSGALPEFDAMGQVLQASLKTIGITMNIQDNPIGTWAGKTYPGLLVPNYQSVPGEPAFSMNFLLSGRAEDNWNNTTYDNLYAKAVGTSSPKARKAVFCSAMKLENQQLPLVTPLVFDVVHATSSNVSGVWEEGGGQLHLENASIG
jgi:peptide/nickel transport system substrate-binding protein